MESLTFDSSDVGLVEATVSKLYSKLRIDAVGSCTRTQITRRVMAPGLGFDDLDYSFDIGYSGEAQGRLIICDVISSTIRRVGNPSRFTAYYRRAYGTVPSQTLYK